MSYEKLKEYVEEQKLHKANESNIRFALEEKGWNKDLVEKAILEVFESKEEDNLKFLGLLKNSWNNFTEHISRYLLIMLASVLVPFIPIIIFGAPIAYDILVFKFRLSDFLTGPFVPLIYIYTFAAFIFILVLSFWGKLSLIIASTSNGDFSVKHVLRKAWKILGGYIWIQAITFVIVAILALPSIAIIASLAGRLLPAEFTILFIGSSLIILIPSILASIMLSFAPFIFVNYGARGMTAIKSSYKLVKNNFEFVFTKQLLLILSFLVVSVILSSFYAVGEIAKIFLSPLLVIFMAKLYFVTDKMNKEAQKENSELI